VNGLRTDRRLGRYAGKQGPTLLVVGGIHGNEPAGVLAAQDVLAQLEEGGIEVAGSLAAVAGNVGALAAARRYLVRDLNRCWLPEDIARLATHPASDDDPEYAEMRALAAVIDEEAAQAERLVILDLHTTSGDSPPFSLMSDTLRNRRLARALPVPVILGLEENVDGTLLEYATELGHTVIVVESGRHDDPAAVELHKAVIWLAAAAAELLPATAPQVVDARARLRAVTRGLPRVAEVRYRHEVAPGSAFAMNPGYRGFQDVERGELLGHDRAGPIPAPAAGRILMPLYQDQGDDGFFLVRRVSRFWLWLSGILRRLKLARMMLLLPGVQRHPARSYALRVNPRVARWFVVEIFHLFGYRKRRREGEYLVFTRRTPG